MIISSQEALTIAGWESINSMYKGKLLTFMYQVCKSELPGNIISFLKVAIVVMIYEIVLSIRFLNFT